MFSFFNNLWTSARDEEKPVASTSRLPIRESVAQVQNHATTSSDPAVRTNSSNAESGEPLSPPSPISPPPAAYYSPTQIQERMIIEFFGGRSQRTRTREPAPPAYSQEGDCEKLPTYDECTTEPVTLARYLFVYGFFFPVFWLVGITIIFSPLRVSPGWESDKTEEEKQQLLSEMRATELKWAKRCLLATVTLISAVAILALIIVFAK
ncbi:hypothetical protein BJ138DRAFT_1066079 [Hygrophoropsis aurantiaca]|uniref:Uncharacterized protein n=1 Tax=Hygrophoropsis aurantiaca TaxID=72124 RepID=A0ACB8A948_9AGAM|nr:hypothetical protein BJ138DRAFT_1066079 [Hygrophoropsis aurantiaca]